MDSFCISLMGTGWSTVNRECWNILSNLCTIFNTFMETTFLYCIQVEICYSESSAIAIFFLIRNTSCANYDVLASYSILYSLLAKHLLL